MRKTAFGDGWGALLGVVLLLAACGDGTAEEEPGHAGEPTALEQTLVELRDRALADSRAHQLLRSLTVEVGPRLAGSPGDRAAVAWALARMQAMGFENVRGEAVTVPHWERGEASGEILEPFPQPMVLTALGGSVGTAADGITADVVAVSSLDELAGLTSEEVAGKILFVNQETERHRAGSGYGRTGRVRREGPARAAEKGAAALLIRSVGTGTQRFAHTGALRYEDGIDRIPSAALAVPDADILAAQAATGRLVRFRLYLGSEHLPEEESANVIGEVLGRELPEEIVLLGCHLDSWDLGTGAHDDGAGCAVVMTAAKLVKELPKPPRRTIRVVLFANEEFGLSGARAYAEERAEELELHQLAIESDLGGDRVWRFATRIDEGVVPEAERVAGLLEPLGIEWHGNEARGGADLIPLREPRVPRADLTQDATRYFDYHHTLDDTFDKIDPEALAQNVAAYATVAFWAAETEADFGRAPEAADAR